MSRLLQPVGQKRLTNIAVVRLKKHGSRFEIACYKNKVLSWRSCVEKDIDEVLQSQIVYSNVSKGVLANSSDLKSAFGMDDQEEICKQILQTGELQVAGKERESAFSSQFKNVATLVMEKTINSETHKPYPLAMIEKLMHEIHFKVDPNDSPKKQALSVIRALQNHCPIKRAPMKLRLTVPGEQNAALLEQLSLWGANVVDKDASDENLVTITCDIEPCLFRECDDFVRKMQGKTENLHATNADFYTDTNIDEHEEETPAPAARIVSSEVKQKKCSTCDCVVGDGQEYREHFKSEWHRHNLLRKSRQLPALSAEECIADLKLEDSKSDRKDYSRAAYSVRC